MKQLDMIELSWLIHKGIFVYDDYETDFVSYSVASDVVIQVKQDKMFEVANYLQLMKDGNIVIQIESSAVSSINIGVGEKVEYKLFREVEK